MSWQQTVTDPDEIKVFMALDGPEYTWRTMSAVARQTGLSEARVAQILAKYNLQLTRLSETPSVSGTALVGLLARVGERSCLRAASLAFPACTVRHLLPH